MLFKALKVRRAFLVARKAFGNGINVFLKFQIQFWYQVKNRLKHLKPRNPVHSVINITLLPEFKEAGIG